MDNFSTSRVCLLVEVYSASLSLFHFVHYELGICQMLYITWNSVLKVIRDNIRRHASTKLKARNTHLTWLDLRALFDTQIQ